MTQLAKFEAWFTNFRLERILKKTLKDIDGRLLYEYQLTTQELIGLKNIFIYYKGLSKHNDRLNKYYGATFVLLASEFYRREYERQDWGWSAVYDYIGVVDVPDRENLIEWGFRYWKLPTITNDDGKNRKFLGSVLNQGGLPWKLVQNKSDSFGRVIHECFNNYVDIINTYGSLLSEIEHLSKKFYIPEYLANPQSFELISGVVETVIELQKKYANEAMLVDPAKYLTDHEPDWIYKFPIPLDEDNAQTLLKSWFTSAKEQVEKGQRGPKNHSNHFIAEHVIQCDHISLMADHWLKGLQTRLIQPEILSIPTERLMTKPVSSRIELLIYENENVIAKGKTFYAEQNDLGCLIIKCRADASHFLVRRRNPHQSLIVKLMNAGSLVYEEVIENGSLLEENTPLFLIQENEFFKCVSDAGSYTTTHTQGYLYAQNEFKFIEQRDCEVLYQGTVAQCILVKDQISISNEQDLFTYEVNSKDPIKAVHLRGQEEIAIKGSRTIYRQFPTLINAPDGTVEYVNGKRLLASERQCIYGNVNYQAKTSDGKTVLVRRFAILPMGYHVVTDPIELDQNVCNTNIYLQQSTIKTHENLEFQIVNLFPGLEVRKIQANHFCLSVWDLDSIPAFVTIEVPSSHHVEALKLYIPLSVIGMRAQKDHKFLPQNIRLSLSLDELVGHDIVMQSVRDITRVNIEMKLHSVNRYNNLLVPLMTRSILRPMSQQVRLNLIAFKDEIEQLLSIISDLDSYVSLNISTLGLGECHIDIKRFHIQGKILNEDNGSNHNCDILLQGLDEVSIGKMDFQWIPLVQPQQFQRLSIERAQSTVNNQIQVLFNETINHEPLGLVVASNDSDLTLRPILSINNKALDKTSYENRSIEYAIIHYHPQDNKSSFHDVFSDMAQDLSHPAWQYFEHLMKTVPTSLSLSTFAVWKQLIANQQLVAIAFFKLNFSIEFCLRMRDELGLIWEAINFEHWKSAWNLYDSVLRPDPHSSIIPIHLIMQIFERYMDKIKALVPMKNVLEDMVHVRKNSGLLNEDAVNRLRTAKNSLIYHNDGQWPIFLQDELQQWFNQSVIDQQLLSHKFLKELLSSAEPQYRYASLLLPVYMAAISAGISKFSDVLEYDNEQKKNSFEKLMELKFAYQQISNFDHDWYNTCYYYALVEFMDWS